jgi:hypothetical protein
MYQRAQEQQAAASGAATDGAGATTNGAGAEDVVDAEVVDEGR